MPGLTRADGTLDPTWAYVTVPVALVTTAMLFGLVVPRGGARAAVLAASAALASLVLYRVGVTLPLAGAALVIARGVPDEARPRTGKALVALGLGILTMGAFGYFALLDAAVAVERMRT